MIVIDNSEVAATLFPLIAITIFADHPDEALMSMLSRGSSFECHSPSIIRPENLTDFRKACPNLFLKKAQIAALFSRTGPSQLQSREQPRQTIGSCGRS